MSQLVNFVIPHIDCVPIKLNLLEKSEWRSHSLLTPDLVLRASVGEARLSATIPGFTLSYGQRCPHSPTEQPVSKTLSWPRNTKHESMNLSLCFCQPHRIINSNSKTLFRRQKITINLKMSLFTGQKAWSRARKKKSLFFKARITSIRQGFWKRPGPDFDPAQL